MLQTFARHGLAGMVASLLAMPVMAEPLSDDAANQLLQRISDMEREVSTLRGDNEKLRNEVENLQKDQKDRFTQVDEKMDKLKDTAKPTDINSSMSSSSTTRVSPFFRMSRMGPARKSRFWVPLDSSIRSNTALPWSVV